MDKHIAAGLGLLFAMIWQLWSGRFFVFGAGTWITQKNDSLLYWIMICSEAGAVVYWLYPSILK